MAGADKNHLHIPFKHLNDEKLVVQEFENYKTIERWANSPVLPGSTTFVKHAFCTTALIYTTSYVQVPGCLVTFTTQFPNSICNVWCVFDHQVTSVGCGTLIGTMRVDGTLPGGEAILAEVAGRGTVATMTSVILAAVGEHTVDLAARKSLVGGGAQTLEFHTKMIVMVLQPVVDA